VTSLSIRRGRGHPGAEGRPDRHSRQRCGHHREQRDVDDLARRRAKLAPDRTSVYRFDASLKVLNDMITPDRDGQQVDLVYPVLIGLMSGS
jgi:hypothetical protein